MLMEVYKRNTCMPMKTIALKQTEVFFKKKKQKEKL